MHELQDLKNDSKKGCIIKRFHKLVRVRAASNASPCWLWLGPKNKGGYGSFEFKTTTGRCTAAHKASYMIYNGPIPKGMDVCHTCDVRNCVCPWHLWLGTRKENLKDMVDKGRGKFGDHNRNKTHCKYGHELTEKNIVYRKDKTSRQCRTCSVIKTQIWRAKNKPMEKTNE